jgi:DNA-binding transcriptional MerR regulator
MDLAEAQPSGRPATAGLNIAAVSRKTGIAPDTLRKWERRYGVLRPKRTAGGQRRYDDFDVARVEWLRDRLGEGFRISEAAALLDPAGDHAHGSAEELRDGLVEAAQAADPTRIVALVEQAFSLHPVEDAIEAIVQPALARVGSEWCERRGAIAEEHLLSETVRGRLERMLADRRPGVRGRVVLACAPGERHDIGLLALGVLLQADGWLVVYLGADTPLDAVVELVERVDAKALCVSVSSASADSGFPAAVADAGLPKSVRVLVGGSGVDGPQKLRTTVKALRRS